MDRLMDAAYANDVAEMLPILGEIVTTYRPAETRAEVIRK